MKLFFQHYGEGFPLLILHGLLGASGNWHSMSRNVFGPAYSTYAIDQRNHGRSPHVDAMSYPLMAEDIARFMDDQALERAHLLGHSMGGKVAMTFALTYPDRVERLVVADIAPRAYPPHHTTIFDALSRLDVNALGSRAAIDEALAADIPSWPVRQFLLKNLAAESGGGFTWKMNLDALIRNYDALSAAVPESGIFTGSALFIRGGASDYVRDADEQDIYRLFPSAELLTVPGAGHWVHAEAPEAFGEAVMAFLAR